MTPTRTPWKMVGLLCATATASYICRANVSIAGVFLLDDFHLSEVELGKIFSAFLLGYAFFQVPAGLLADRFGARRLLTWAAWMWVLFTMGFAVVGWGPFSLESSSMVLLVFLVFRFLLGVSETPTYIASAKGVSQWVLPPFQARANGIVIASIGVGSALATTIVSLTMVQWGWRIALLCSAIPALAIAWIWLKTTDPPIVQISNPKVSDIANDKSKLWSPGFIFLTLSYSLQGYVGYIFISWFFTYLVKIRHFNIQEGGIMTAMTWILSIVAIPLGGYLADKLATGKLGPTWGRRLIPMTGLILSGLMIALGAHTDNATLAALTLAIATALVLSVEGPFWATMMSLSGTKSGAAGGIMNMGCNIGGLISPILTPYIAGYIGWENALHIAGLLAIAGGLLWLGITPNVNFFKRQGQPD